MELPYNAEDKDSIIQFARLLIGKSILSEFTNDILALNLTDKDKGQLGKVIEQLYFQYKPNSKATADFEAAGLELKSSGLKELKKNKLLVAKERLSLSMINFNNIVNENFEEHFLNGKNSHLLLVFYLYQIRQQNQLDSKIMLAGDWKYSGEDIEIIKKDWEYIKHKISIGKAHELSEGDTFYLGACRQGNMDDKLQKHRQ